jgi:two-component system response regulator AlgR
MKIVVVDDEELARRRLVSLIKELGPPYRLVGEASNGAQALERCAQLAADLVLLDIRMPEMDGLEVARRLAETATPPAVIFTTAFEEHALEAFDSAALDYLLKPIRRERLLASLQRSQRLTRSQLNAVAVTAEPTPHLSASYRGGVKTLPLDRVIYLRAEAKYVVARYAGGELLLEESLKNLQARYPVWFLRIHRNALVSRRHLTGLEKDAAGNSRAVMRECEETLEISRRHLPEVRRLLRGEGR